MDTESLYRHYLSHPGVCTDTRRLTPGCIFFALRGEQFNGNHFATEAIQKGASLAVIDDPAFQVPGTVLSEDSLKSLHDLAAYHRNQINIPIIAVTGSNGKTTTKELLNAVLSSTFITTATSGNLNNHIGVPLTLLSIRPETQIAIIEMGANHRGEIAELSELARPDYGLITNIGKAHIGGFGGLNGVIEAKKALYDFIRDKGEKLLVNGSDPLLMKLSEGIPRMLYLGGDLSGMICAADPFLCFTFSHNGEEHLVETRLVGAYNFPNAMAAVAAGIMFGITPGSIIKALRDYNPSNQRSQLIKTVSNTLILDSYNANPSSMEAAILNFREMTAQKKGIILGDMLELGTESLAEHEAIAGLVADSAFDLVLFIGPDFQKVNEGRDIPSFTDSAQAASWLLEHRPEGYTILIKGSRGIQTEKVVPSL